MYTVDFVSFGTKALIGEGACTALGRAAKAAVGGGRICLITDTGVPQEHIDKVFAQLDAAGFAADVFALPEGERNKTLASVERIYSFLYEKGYTRADGIAGLGGGCVGDAAGFAAATYLRGLPFISLPSTIIAQTDSAYGGKTGVDYLSGKNLIGCFSHPKAVLCDTSFLRTLKESDRISGMGEIIKYGAIAEPQILATVSEGLPSDETIALCVDVKRRYAEADEFDRGCRRVLNFGHTFGHAFEAASGYSLPHGQAVALGMLTAARLGTDLGVTEEGVYETLEDACRAAGLSTEWRGLVSGALGLLSMDKKSDGASLDFVLLEKLGVPIRKKLPFGELEKAITQ
jgi:3-dehydroquinate synthase